MMAVDTYVGPDPDVSPDTPRRRPTNHWQFVAVAAVIAIAALLALSVARNENMQWAIVWEYLFNEQILLGVAWTLLLTTVCMVVAVILGVVIAVMRTAENRYLNTAAVVYLWFFRGTPLLVQLIFWFNLALVFPQLGLPMLFGENAPWGIDSNVAISWFTAAVLGFGLHEAAYMSEIVRGGFLAVDRGQKEAAQALGMDDGLALRRILLPQAMRVIIPPTMNQFVNLLKATSLVAFIAGEDLLSAATTIYARNFQVIPLLVVASLWYLTLVSFASILQHFVERRLGKGFGASGASGPTAKVKDGVAGGLGEEAL